MTGLQDTDIRLTGDWILTPATDGDAPVCSGLDCLFQAIALEAVTQPGDLFYDLDYGWGLYSYIQSEYDDLTRLELVQRVRSRLERWEVIEPGSIEVDTELRDDTLHLSCKFQFQEDAEERALNLVISPAGVEVIET